MAGKTNLSATLFAQKKLLGKTSTGVHRADNNEPIPSGLQVTTQTIFAENVPENPVRTPYLLQSASAGANATVEYVDFLLEPITGSVYDANTFDGDAGAQGSGNHAYRLVLTGNYQNLSSNSRRGKDSFRNNQILHWTLGRLQLVSPGFSNSVPNPYNILIFSGSRDVDDEIPLQDELDWQVDYFSGILFVQDFDSTKIPTRAKGFIYIGKMLSGSLGEVSAGGGGSGTGVGWIGSAPGTISSTGSVLVGTSTSVPQNAEISFSSVGGAVFNEKGRASDFRVETSGKENALLIDGHHNQVKILSGGAGTSVDPTAGTDISFFVSGALDAKGGSKKGVSLFSGDVVSSGSVSVARGLSGSLTKLFDGRSYIVAGNNIIVASSSNGQITISSNAGGGGASAVGWIGRSPGQIDTTGSLGVSGSLNVLGPITAPIGLSGSLTKLSNGSSYLIAGSNITINSSSNGPITISSTAGGTPGGSNTQIQFNNGGNFGGSSAFTFTGTEVELNASNPKYNIRRSNNSEESSLTFKGSAGVAGASIAHGATSNDLIFKTFGNGGSSLEEMLRLGGYQSADNRQVIFLSGSGIAASDMQPHQSTDIAFFVSGAVDSRGTSSKGTAAFGGDVAISGTLAVNLSDEGVGSQFVVTTDGKVGIGTSTPAYKLSVGGNMEVGEFIYHKNDANTFIRFQEDQLHIKAGGRSMINMKEDASDQVLILSGAGSANSPDPAGFTDTNFFVSGTIGSKGTTNAGTSVFGGDLVSSGSLTAKFGLSGSLTRLHDGKSYLKAGSNVTILSSSNGQITISASSAVNFAGGNGNNNQMITADGNGNIVAESNISFNGSQLEVTGSILPGADKLYDLGGPNNRFANVYTGDLHLRNERGHWTIVEEAEYLTVVNNLTGKKYKMVLEPLE